MPRQRWGAGAAGGQGGRFRAGQRADTLIADGDTLTTNDYLTALPQIQGDALDAQDSTPPMMMALARAYPPPLSAAVREDNRLRAVPELPAPTIIDTIACLARHEPIVRTSEPGGGFEWMGSWCMRCQHLVHEHRPERRPESLHKSWANARRIYLAKADENGEWPKEPHDLFVDPGSTRLQQHLYGELHDVVAPDGEIVRARISDQSRRALTAAGDPDRYPQRNFAAMEPAPRGTW